VSRGKVPAEKLLARPKKGAQVPLLLFLAGEDAFLKRRLLETLRRRHVEEEGLNYLPLRGSEIRWAEVAEAASTYPMLSEYRLIVLADLSKVRDPDHRPFLSYLEAPSPSTILVVDGTGGDGRRQPQKTFQSKALQIACDPLTMRNVAAYIRRRAGAFELIIQAGAAEALADRVGPNRGALESELKRLSIYLHPEKRLSTEAVAEVVGRSRHLSVFEYIGALARRDYGRAVASLRVLLQDGEAPLGILALIARQFRMMLSVAEAMAAGVAAGAACRSASVPPFMERKFLAELREWRLADLERIYALLFRTDRLMKSRAVPPAAELELLTARLIERSRLSTR